MIRKRYTEGSEDCPYCGRILDNCRALTTHISKAHKNMREKSNLYLSAHRIQNNQNKLICFILENKTEGSNYRNQTILTLKFKKKAKI